MSEYFTLQKRYETIYGPKTVVLYNTGFFYEIFEYDPVLCTDNKYKMDAPGAMWNEHIGHTFELSEILNYYVTIRDTRKPYSFNNSNVMGFPVMIYNKILRILLDNGYTVIRVDQCNDVRSVAEICSPL